MTPVEIQNIRDMKSHGMTDQQIGNELGYTGAAIWWQRKKHGIPANRAKPLYMVLNCETEFTGTPTECAEFIGCGRCMIHKAYRTGKTVRGFEVVKL